MKKTIAVIFGGKSAEHDVSIITAHIPVIKSLLAAGNFEVVPVYIAKDGSWYSDPSLIDLEFFKRTDFEEQLAKLKKLRSKLKKLRLLFDKGLKLIKPGAAFSKEKIIGVDVVFPAMHGTFGEDGSLMGLLRMAGVPFVGCDMAASAVAMDKVLTKQVLEAEKIPVVPYVWFTKEEWLKNSAALREKIARLRFPLFVKPVHLGSSIGITKAKTAAELENAIEVALHYDDKALVEEGVANLIEVTLPIMGNGSALMLANIERPLNKAEFFDFYDKYINGGGNKQDGAAAGSAPVSGSSAASAPASSAASGVNTGYSELPAKIPEELAAEVRELGAKTYKTLGCAGIARVDFLIDSGSAAGASGEAPGKVSGDVLGNSHGNPANSRFKIYVNEVNTLPGSLYHHNWRSAGVSGVELVTKLVALAEERFAAQKNITFTFKSEILSKISGPKVG